MAFDVRGGLKNTGVSVNRYVVIEELLSNAIDSYLIRRDRYNDCPVMKVDFCIDFFDKDMLGDGAFDMKVSCTDNGSGFGKEQIQAFVTKDTTYKDSLNIEGIGKCKGTGRVQFFHYFDRLDIESKTLEDGVYYLKKLTAIGGGVISEDDFSIQKYQSTSLLTRVVLDGFKSPSNVCGEEGWLRKDYSAKAVYKYIYLAFMQRLIVLKGIIGDFEISIVEKYGDEEFSEVLRSDSLPAAKEVKKIPLVCGHDSESKNSHYLNVTRYSLPADSFVNSNHEVALCANSAIVSSVTNKFIKAKRDQELAINGSYELILVESDFLEEKVNDQRDGFKLSAACSANKELYEEFSMQDVIESLEDYVFDILTPPDFDRVGLIKSTEHKFGISQAMIDQAKIKIRYTDSEDNIAKRVLKKYQEDIVDETSNIFDLKKELLNLDPVSQDFREKVSKLSWVYTSTLKKMDMANLSQLVVRRSSMLEVLSKAVKSMLECQTGNDGRKQNEKIIHNIFFPTGKDDEECSDHDIWILNEEYHYFDHISSDKSLASISWKGENLFDDDIDSSLEDLFKKNNDNHRLKRPDIAIFNEEGAAIIIEFKAPGVELQEHVLDLVQYSRLLAAKSKGKISKFYGYLIGDTIDESRMSPSYTRFPSGGGYFNTDRIVDPNTNVQYGELYSEVIFYDQFVERAENRLKIFKERLSIDI